MKKLIALFTIVAGLLSTTYGQTTDKKTKEKSVQSTLAEFQVQGITWHALTLTKDKFEAYKKMLNEVMHLKPMMEMEGVAVYMMDNGTLLELYMPDKVPAFTYNGEMAFGFRVTDIAAASKALEAAGFKMLSDITVYKDMNYSYRHFMGPDGMVYGLNEQK